MGGGRRARLRYESADAIDQLLVDKRRFIMLGPLGAEPGAQVLLVEEEPKEDRHLEVLLREHQRAKVGEAQLGQPEEREVREHSVQRLVGALGLAGVLEVEGGDEDFEEFLVPCAPVEHLRTRAAHCGESQAQAALLHAQAPARCGA